MHPSIYKYLTMYICFYIVYLYWEQITDAEQLWKKLVEIGMNNAPAGEKPEKRQEKDRRRKGQRNVEMCHDLGGKRKRGSLWISVLEEDFFSRANSDPLALWQCWGRSV